MTTIYDPAESGFDERLGRIDRCQIALLREIAAAYGPRLTLKGGMAMRAVFGSMRLTRDIDFDRDPSVSLNSAKKAVPKALMRAATNAGMRRSSAEVTKSTGTTIRVRLVGHSSSGVELRFEVEVSGRGALAGAHRRAETVVPPPGYGMAPFTVETYSNEMLAAMKIGAAMADARNVPRDLYDLADLAQAGANPASILASRPAAVLAGIRERAFSKLDLVGYDRAREELLPYLPPTIRDALTEAAWVEKTLRVGEAIESWVADALRIQQRSLGDATPQVSGEDA